MRKDRQIKELNLTERLAQLNGNLFDGDLDSYEIGDDGQDLQGRHFVVDEYGPRYPAPVAENPGIYRLSFDRLIKQGTLRKEGGVVISRSKNGREFVIIKGIMIPKREYDENLEEIVRKSAIERDSEEEESDEEPEQVPTHIQREPKVAHYQEPVQQEFAGYGRKRKFKRPKDRKRMHEPGWRTKPEFSEPKSKTYHLNEDFKSFQAVAAALAGKPAGKYFAQVDGRERKFLVNSKGVRIYSGKIGIALSLYDYERLERDPSYASRIRKERKYHK